jgi:hypothetical protein
MNCSGKNRLAACAPQRSHYNVDLVELPRRFVVKLVNVARI